MKGRFNKLSGDVPAGNRLLLHELLLDLDQRVSVSVNGGEPKAFKVTRDPKVIEAALADRLDPKACPIAAITRKGGKWRTASATPPRAT